MTTDCTHPRAIVKNYVGSAETYRFCPDCWGTLGGEETPAKHALIRAAAEADDRGLSGDDERHPDE